ARAFYEERQKIADRLFALLLSLDGKGPVMVAAHNLMLCKNAALVSAFVHVARLLAGQADRFRFFSIIHDYAEQGRTGQMEEIGRLERMGVAIGQDLAMRDAAILQVAVNETVARVFSRAGYHAAALMNPVVPDGERVPVREGERYRDRLFSYCRMRGIAAAPDKKIFSCPARTVARKNPVEAIALACIAGDGNLLLGPAGVSSEDRRIHAAIRETAATHLLPVVTDIQEIMGGQARARKNPVPLIYGISDAVLSTAVSENFGYLLYEPFLYGMPVAGRRPAGFHFPSTVDLRYLYERLPVPAQWVDLKVLRDRYDGIADRCFGRSPRRRVFHGRLESMLCHDTVDFALFDDWMQIDLIGKLLRSDRMKEEWLSLLRKKTSGWPGLSAVVGGSSPFMIDLNRRAVMREFSFARFERAFRRCFCVVPPVMRNAGNREVVRKAFMDPRTFRVR
ncbi:MAG: hypothetical protein JXA71_19595, partial [Chitinispirillaceae bacterium]|nr:hypothetical protein [Chitinispirillaceae bacterium]